MSEISTRTVGPKAAKRAVQKAFKHNRPLFLWGPPGIGKSEIVHQIGKTIDAHVIDIRLSLWDPTDIKGIPTLIQLSTKWYGLHHRNCQTNKWQVNIKT